MFEITAKPADWRSKVLATTAIFALFGLGQQAFADSGFYIGFDISS